MYPSHCSLRTRRAALMVVLAAAVALLASGLVGGSPAYAASYCESCHMAGGPGSNPASHPVPPYAPAWDSWDGQCTVCHEWDSDYAPDYQSAPYGPVSIDDSGDHYWIRDTHCIDCHAGWAAHGGTISFPLPAAINMVGTDCEGCHTSGMSVGEVYEFTSPVPQITAANHTDPTTEHAGAISAQCVVCHEPNLTVTHDACGVCHSAVPVDGQTCMTCHPGYSTSHGFPLYNSVYNPNAQGYLAWGYVASQTGSASSPHGGYTTTSTKCAVCHAVHRADPDGVVLTAWGGRGSATPAFSSTMAPFESCFFCHGNGATFTDRTVEFFVTAGGVLSPHTTCGRCHTASPHGAGTSQYAVLQSKLINEHADAQLAFDLAGDGTDSYNGLTASMFDLSDPALYGQGITLATGYLCVGCHGSAANQHVFAVNERGATPAVHYSPSGSLGSAGVTGHQVWLQASDTWFDPAAWYSGGGAHDYYLATYRYKFADGYWRHFKVASATTFNEVSADGETPLPGGLTNATTADILAAYGAWESVIAWNSALGCSACHDATRTNGMLAFPHGYVNASGAPAPKWANRTETGAIIDPDGYLQTSFLWMTVAGDADDSRVLMRTRGENGLDANLDGACLKCHLSGDRMEGIGSTPDYDGSSAPGDTTPPVTTSNAAGPYAGSATITLSASDESGGSGVANTFYTINGGAQQSGTTVSLTAPGTYTIAFWSVDVAGNAEAPTTVTVVVNPPVGIGTIHFAWDSSPGSYAYYEVRNASWGLVSSGWGYEWDGWDGHFYVPVTTSTQYYIRILWFDPFYDEESEYWTPVAGDPRGGGAVNRPATGEWYTPVLIATPGTTYDYPY